MVTGHPHVKDLTGQEFNRWFVVSFHGLTPKGMARWLCRCQCGQQKIIAASSLKKGDSKSCGCLSKEVAICRHRSHGCCSQGNEHQLYNTWYGIKQRCTNPENINFKHYGGRGITMQNDWVDDPAKFYNDIIVAIGPRPDLEWTLDRIDNDGHYELVPKINLRWATHKCQAQNRRSITKQQAIIDTLRQEIEQLKKTLMTAGFQEPSTISPFQYQRSLFDTSGESFHTVY